MPLATQAKLLRVLQEREVRPLGATRALPLDVRLVSATHRNLSGDHGATTFRQDLYYRIAVVRLTLPPLRERSEDLPELARTILGRVAERTGRKAPELDGSALRVLAGHPFPGNVRELENVLTRALVLCAGPRITASDLDLGGARALRKRGRTRQEFEREERAQILDALRAARWNISVVSRSLGIPRNTLYRKLARYGLERASSAP
jgi:DNA-binding NtrC family response regulator